MPIAHFARIAAIVLTAGAGAAALSACTYVERDRTPSQPQTVVVPPPQPQATVVTPMAPPPPTVTVRPSY